MGRMKNRTKDLAGWIGRPVLWLLTSAIPVFIAACYGPYYDESRAGGKVVSKATGEGIPDILVSCLSPGGGVLDQTYTLAGDGAFELWYQNEEPCETLGFEDVDGAENGAFQALEIPFDPATGEQTVELEPVPEA
jgi:hypothetical protein